MPESIVHVCCNLQVVLAACARQQLGWLMKGPCSQVASEGVDVETSCHAGANVSSSDCIAAGTAEQPAKEPL